MTAEDAAGQSTGGQRLRQPERLASDHHLTDFRNGRHPSLDDWLRDRALTSEGLSARTYVVCAAGPQRRVVGYYTISTAMAQRVALPSAPLRRGMPDQVPLLLIGRLAVDQSHQGMGLGTDLLSDTIKRCIAVAEVAGVRAIVAHAIDDAAVSFYQRHGFRLSPLGEKVMLLPIEAASALIEEA